MNSRPDATADRPRFSVQQADGVHVRDLGSTNGTRLAAVLAREAESLLWPREKFGRLLGRSEAMRALFDQVAIVAAIVLVPVDGGEHRNARIRNHGLRGEVRSQPRVTTGVTRRAKSGSARSMHRAIP